MLFTDAYTRKGQRFILSGEMASIFNCKKSKYTFKITDKTFGCQFKRKVEVILYWCPLNVYKHIKVSLNHCIYAVETTFSNSKPCV